MTRPEQPTTTLYRYQSSGSPRPALLILAVTLPLTVLLPAADLRLLAALFALPSLVWLAYECRRRRTGLLLTIDTLIIRHPLGLRPEQIPYTQIGGVIHWTRGPRLGIVYYIPRPPFEGETDPRPPRLRATATAPLTDLPTALADIRQRITQAQLPEAPFPRLTETDVEKRLRSRRLRRVGLSIAAFLATPLIVIIAAHIVFALLRALR